MAMRLSIRPLKKLLTSALAIAPLAIAFMPSAAMASIAPDQQASSLQPANALPFFVAASRFGGDLLDLPALAPLPGSITASGAPPQIPGLRLALLPLAAGTNETNSLAVDYWKHLDGLSQLSPARRPRVVPPMRGEVLGSVALAVSNAPLTQRWRAALAEQADSYFGGDCHAARTTCASRLRQHLAGAVTAAQRQGELEALRSINAAVNAQLKYRNDMDTYGVSDYWAKASEVLQRGTGDCKGYAILKMWMLLAAGFDRSQIRLQLVKIPATGQDHAILVVNTQDGQFVLDNIASTVRRDSEVSEYTPLLSFVKNETHIHGFKRLANAS
jgi:predicted transglutaminase-like cysteine proteinase